MNSVDSFEMLHQNIDKYLIQEYQHYESEINYVVNNLNNITNLSTHYDIYTLTILLEKTKSIANLRLNSVLCECIRNIQILVKDIYLSKDGNVLGFLSNLRSQLKNYRKLLNQHFNFLQEDVLRYEIHEFAKLIHKRINSKSNDELLPQVKLIEQSLKQFSQDSMDSFFMVLMDILSQIKTFSKTYDSLGKYFPLSKNPIIELLRFFFLKKHNMSIGCKSISYSEELYIKAYKQVYPEKLTPNEEITSKNTVLDNIDNQYLNNVEIQKKVDYAIFSTSQYFTDFDIKSSLIVKSQNSEKQPPKTFKGFIEKFRDIPKSLPSVEKLYSDLNQSSGVYKSYFQDRKPQVNPAEGLSALANFYFHKNVISASHINYLRYTNNKQNLSIIFEFEKVFSKVSESLQAMNEVRFETYMGKLLEILENMDDIYTNFESHEKRFLESSDFFMRLETIASNYKRLNYKELMLKYSASREDIDSTAHIKKINKYIDTSNHHKAIVLAKEITFSLLRTQYYKPTKLYSIYELPPLSSIVYEGLKSNESLAVSTAFNRIDQQYKEYWEV